MKTYSILFTTMFIMKQNRPSLKDFTILRVGWIVTIMLACASGKESMVYTTEAPLYVSSCFITTKIPVFFVQSDIRVF